MAVTFDSKFESGAGSQASPFSYLSSSGTVAGSVGANSNRVLIAFLCGSDPTPVTSPAVTWDSGGTNQAMTLIGSAHNGTSLGQIFIFGLIAPTTGSKTISASWTGTIGTCVLGAVSVYNADQTTGWQNAGNDGPTTGTAVSCAVTSANGNMAIVGLVDTNATSATITAGTSDWDERAYNGNYNGGHLASTGGTTTLTWTLGTSVEWIAKKVDVIAFTQGGPTYTLMGQACL